MQLISFLLVFLGSTATALDGVVAPSVVKADTSFEVTFENGGSDPRDQYRVFLAAASIGQNGPFCHLQNLTSLVSPFTASIPACVGPDNDDYSIGIADITTGQGATFGNKFNLTGGTGIPTPYEQHLRGAPFWDAYNLPCTALPCARECAQASYPADLNDEAAYNTMSACIKTCSGVGPSQNASQPAHQSQGNDVPVAVVTLASEAIVTAWQTVVSSEGTLVTEAILGSQTVILGDAVQTIRSATVSLATEGVVVGGTSTIAFSTAVPTSSSQPPSETIGMKGDGMELTQRSERIAGMLLCLLLFM